MIRFQRALRARGGKGREAAAWAQEVTGYLNGKLPDVNLKVFTHRFGDVNMIIWQADFETLTSLDTYQQAVNGDPGYWKLVDKSAGLYVEDSIQDTVLESL